MDETTLKALLDYDSRHLRAAPPEELASRARLARSRRRVAAASLAAVVAVVGTVAVVALPSGGRDALTADPAGPPQRPDPTVAPADSDRLLGQAAAACRQELGRRGVDAPLDRPPLVVPNALGWRVTLDGPDGTTTGGWECDVEATGDPARGVVVDEVRPVEPAPELDLDLGGNIACRATQVALVALKAPGRRSPEEVDRAVDEALATARTEAAASRDDATRQAGLALATGRSGLPGFYAHCLARGWGGIPSLARSAPPAPASCSAPVGSSVPDCPVVPASVGTTGTPGYLPPGWALYAEKDEPLPTGTAERIQSWQRRYGPGPGSGMVLVNVLYGDVTDPAAQAAAYEGSVDESLLPGQRVVAARHEGATRFLWQVRDRVVLDVEFRGTGLSESEQLRVLRGLASG